MVGVGERGVGLWRKVVGHFLLYVLGGFTNFTAIPGGREAGGYYQKFGLGARTGIDVPGEAVGRVPTPEWKKKFSGLIRGIRAIRTTCAVGQGDLLVSPLQMAVAIGGDRQRRHIVQAAFGDPGADSERQGGAADASRRQCGRFIDRRRIWRWCGKVWWQTVTNPIGHGVACMDPGGAGGGGGQDWVRLKRWPRYQ
jgi:hypothetical protein